jgi:hypothetical protein
VSGTDLFPGKPPELRPVCPLCGTWVCSTCGWRRSRASLHWPQQCANCLGTSGSFLPTRHTDRTTREDHEDYARQIQTGQSPADPVQF